jgi:hypothetical protein
MISIRLIEEIKVSEAFWESEWPEIKENECCEVRLRTEMFRGFILGFLVIALLEENVEKYLYAIKYKHKIIQDGW